MAVPQFLLVFGQVLEEAFTDDVLHAHDAGTLAVSVEDHALLEVLADLFAVVMRFHLALHVAAVEVEAVEIRVQFSQRRFVLHQRRTLVA